MLGQDQQEGATSSLLQSLSLPLPVGSRCCQMFNLVGTCNRRDGREGAWKHKPWKATGLDCLLCGLTTTDSFFADDLPVFVGSVWCSSVVVGQDLANRHDGTVQIFEIGGKDLGYGAGGRRTSTGVAGVQGIDEGVKLTQNRVVFDQQEFRARNASIDAGHLDVCPFPFDCQVDKNHHHVETCEDWEQAS